MLLAKAVNGVWFCILPYALIIFVTSAVSWALPEFSRSILFFGGIGAITLLAYNTWKVVSLLERAQDWRRSKTVALVISLTLSAAVSLGLACLLATVFSLRELHRGGLKLRFKIDATYLMDQIESVNQKQLQKSSNLA